MNRYRDPQQVNNDKKYILQHSTSSSQVAMNSLYPTEISSWNQLQGSTRGGIPTFSTPLNQQKSLGTGNYFDRLPQNTYSDLQPGTSLFPTDIAPQQQQSLTPQTSYLGTNQTNYSNISLTDMNNLLTPSYPMSVLNNSSSYQVPRSTPVALPQTASTTPIIEPQRTPAVNRASSCGSLDNDFELNLSYSMPIGSSSLTKENTRNNSPANSTFDAMGLFTPLSFSESDEAAPSRTVYLGNIPSQATAHEILNHVRSGIVESLKIVPTKNCAFISFLDEKAAMLFHSDAILKRLTIGNHEIKIGWGKPTQVQPIVASYVNRYHATRNVYLGNMPSDITESDLSNDLSKYGEIEAIKILPEKRISFVHFTSILEAIRCVQSLPLDTKYRDRKVFYGKDRCAFVTKTQQHNAAQFLGLNPNFDGALPHADREEIANTLAEQSNAAAMIATAAGGASNLGNRTIYLGNLHPDCTVEEICNVVRGGILQNVRPILESHVCFITFIDPVSAAHFYAMSSLHGLVIHNRKIKLGWGKHSGPLPNSISLAVANGASRNIYIGGLDKIPEIAFTKEKLYRDFKPFGDIEQINFFEQRHCCFVNFTNISNAVKAIDGIRNNPDYEKCKINFGKDRCGNAPRPSKSNRHQSRNHQSKSNYSNNKFQQNSLSMKYGTGGHSSSLYSLPLQKSYTQMTSSSSETSDDLKTDDGTFLATMQAGVDHLEI